MDQMTEKGNSGVDEDLFMPKVNPPTPPVRPIATPEFHTPDSAASEADAAAAAVTTPKWKEVWTEEEWAQCLKDQPKGRY